MEVEMDNVSYVAICRRGQGRILTKAHEARV